MAKAEHYYGVHAVESLLEREPERVLTLFTLKGRDDQRLKKILTLDALGNFKVRIFLFYISLN